MGDDRDSDAEVMVVGEQVVAALREQYLIVKWDGDPRYTIQVVGRT